MAWEADTSSAVRCCALTGPGPPSPTTGSWAFAGAFKTKAQARKSNVLKRRMVISINCRALKRLYLSLRCQVSVFNHDATVHHDMDAAGFGSSRSFQIDDPLLDPKVGKAEFKHLVDDGRDELW